MKVTSEMKYTVELNDFEASEVAIAIEIRLRQIGSEKIRGEDTFESFLSSNKDARVLWELYDGLTPTISHSSVIVSIMSAPNEAMP